MKFSPLSLKQANEIIDYCGFQIFVTETKNDGLLPVGQHLVTDGLAIKAVIDVLSSDAVKIYSYAMDFNTKINEDEIKLFQEFLSPLPFELRISWVRKQQVVMVYEKGVFVTLFHTIANQWSQGVVGQGDLWKAFLVEKNSKEEEFNAFLESLKNFSFPNSSFVYSPVKGLYLP